MPDNLQGKVALVTGSSMGIGKAVALGLADGGATVVVNARNSIDQGQSVASEILARGGNACFIAADVTKEDSVSSLFQEIVERHGTIDILVNNAGSPLARPFDELDYSSWQDAIDANLTSAVLCSLAAARVMKIKGRGWIVNTSSVRGLDHAGREGLMGYSAAKAGMNNFTRTLAKELAPDIFVNAIAPGFVETGYMERVTDDLKSSWRAQIPISRFIQPEELVDVYTLLSTSRVFTGSVIVADGGFTLKLA